MTEREQRLRAAVETARHQVRRDGDAALPALVEALHRWCAPLLGDPARAAELDAALAECVSAARQLVRDRPEYLPALAAALYRQSLTLGHRGERARALPPAREALAHYRELADDDLRTFGPPAAAALENLANQLAGTGARTEAVEVAREAVALRRRLAARHPGPERDLELASALADLGIALGEAGRHREAVDVAHEAVAGYRAAGGGRGPDRVAYWAALLSLVEELEHTGRHHEQDRILAELADTRRQAARQTPELIAHLDAALRARGYRIGPDGRPRREARDASDRSQPGAAYGGSDLPQPGAAQEQQHRAAPDAAREKPLRIAELARHGHARAEHGDPAGAVTAFRQALALARQLPAADARTRPTLAAVLHDLGLALGQDGRPAEAIGVLEESVRLHRAELAERGAPVAPLLAESLDTLGSRLAALGRHRAALAATREAVQLQEPVADRTGGARENRELARMLNNLSIRYADCRRHRAARDASRRSVARYRSLPFAGPEHLTGLVHALTNLALREARLRNTGPVAPLIREAVELIHLPRGHQRAQLADSLHWLAWYLGRHGDPATADVAAAAEARLRR
ncbi:tetratricopeptide repeat protein [Kitasatospora griseola]|uniref:tetratricopeptide repeat protein n=1 Tax=Kitasatospora griseola TaxID=2064 RepID=UPI003442CC89